MPKGKPGFGPLSSRTKTAIRAIAAVQGVTVDLLLERYAESELAKIADGTLLRKKPGPKPGSKRKRGRPRKSATT